jgi:hypothetical protein
VTCPSLNRVRGRAVFLSLKSKETIELLLRCRELVRVIGEETKEIASRILRRPGSGRCGGLVRVTSKEALFESKLAPEDVVT